MNGHKKVLPKGMFRRHSLEVTDIVHPEGQNLLAVLVHPPDHPGSIPAEGGQGGDHEVHSINGKPVDYFLSVYFLSSLRILSSSLQLLPNIKIQYLGKV